MFRLIILLMFLLLHPHANSEERYRINVVEYLSSGNEKNLAVNVLTQIYSDTDKEIEVVSFPSERGLLMVNSGELDAEGTRTIDVAKKFKNLIRIPTPVIHYSFYKVCTRLSLCSNNDIYGVPKGNLTVQSYCESSKLKCLYVDNKLLPTMIELGSIDGMLLDQLNLAGFNCDKTNKTFQVSRIPSLAIDMYHYIHKSNAHLAETLDQSIKELKSTLNISELISKKFIRSKPCIIYS